MCPLSSLPDSKQHCLANSSLSGLGACHKSRPLPQVQRRIVGWKPEAEQRLMKCIKLLSWLTHHRFCPPSASPSKRAWEWSFLTQSYIKCELWVLPCPTTPLTLSPLVPPPKGLKLPHPILQKCEKTLSSYGSSLLQYPPLLPCPTTSLTKGEKILTHRGSFPSRLNWKVKACSSRSAS